MRSIDYFDSFSDISRFWYNQDIVAANFGYGYITLLLQKWFSQVNI